MAPRDVGVMARAFVHEWCGPDLEQVAAVVKYGLTASDRGEIEYNVGNVPDRMLVEDAIMAHCRTLLASWQRQEQAS